MRVLVVLVLVFTSSAAFAERTRHPNVQHVQHVQNGFVPHSPQRPPQEHLAEVPPIPPIPPQAHAEPRVRIIEIAPTALCADGIYAYSNPDDFCANHNGISYYFSW